MVKSCVWSHNIPSNSYTNVSGSFWADSSQFPFIYMAWGMNCCLVVLNANTRSSLSPSSGWTVLLWQIKIKYLIYAAFNLHLVWPSNVYADAFTSTGISQVLPLLWYQYYSYRPCSYRDILYSCWVMSFSSRTLNERPREEEVLKGTVMSI